MPWNRQRITDLILECGRIALHYYEDPPGDVKDDFSLVTAADRDIEAFLTHELADPANGVYLLGEETAADHDDAWGRAAIAAECYVVDPVDGTAPYAHHVPVWGISIGYAEGGRLRDGAIYLPITQELFVTENDSVYFSVGDPATARALEPRPQEYRPERLIAISQHVARHGQFDMPNRVHALACAVVPLTYLLLGRYLAVQTHVKIWDVAAALPMLWRLGVTVEFVHGGAPRPELGDDWLQLDDTDGRRWLLRDDCLCGSAAVVARLRDFFAGVCTEPGVCVSKT